MIFATLAWLQTGPETVAALDRLALAQWVTAISVGVLAFFALGAALASLSTLKSMVRTLKVLERAVDKLEPHVEPLIDSSARLVDEAASIAASVRENVDGLSDTISEVNDRVKQALDATEDRVRQLGAVLAVVQEETQAVLLDAAAAARGVQTTARALGNPPRRAESDD